MSVRSTLGRIARDRGRANEDRLLESAARVGPSFEWFMFARRATREEDRRGADVVCETRMGKLFLQAKSSRVGAARFAQRERRIVVEVVILSGNAEWDDGRTRTALRKLADAVARLRAQ